MVSCEPSPGLLGRHQAFAVGQAWLGSQVRGRLLLALSYHLLRPEGWHHWEGGWCYQEWRKEGKGGPEEQGWVEGWWARAGGGAVRPAVVQRAGLR